MRLSSGIAEGRREVGRIRTRDGDLEEMSSPIRRVLGAAHGKRPLGLRQIRVSVTPHSVGQMGASMRDVSEQRGLDAHAARLIPREAFASSDKRQLAALRMIT